MNSLILQVATRFIFPLLVLVSVFLLLRGHHEPGGGFIAGLVAACAIVLVLLAWNLERARETIRLEPLHYVVLGLFLATLGGSIGFALGSPFLTGRWMEIQLAGFPVIKLGTPLLFDIGVFFVVFGISLTIVFELAASGEDEWN